MIKLSRKLTPKDKELLLKQLNQKRQQYGLPALKTIKTDDLIHLQQTHDTSHHQQKKQTTGDGGMYQ